MPDYFRLINETEQIPPEKGEIKKEADGSIVFQTSSGPLRIAASSGEKAFTAIISLNGTSAPAMTVVKNTTTCTFTVTREDAGIYRIISDTGCFIRGGYAVFTQIQNEIDFQGYTTGITDGSATIIYLNMLSAAEGYADPVGDLFIKIEFS